MMLTDVNLECSDYLKVFLFCRMSLNVIEMGKYAMSKWNISRVDNYTFLSDEHVPAKHIVVYVTRPILDIGWVTFQVSWRLKFVDENGDTVLPIHLLCIHK